MADNDRRGFREWVAEKLNPAQPSIASLEPFASPETIVDFEQAYREIRRHNRKRRYHLNENLKRPF